MNKTKMEQQQRIEPAQEKAKAEIKWEDFAVNSQDKYLKLVSGQRVKVGFASVVQSVAKVKDKNEGGGEVEREIPCLNFAVDFQDGAKVDKEFSVTSKKLIAQLKKFDERGLLFSNILEIEKSGEGYQTQYQVFDLGKKA